MDPITEPGVYDIPADTYHADPVAEPSVSASLIKTIIEKSPRHAWLQHPRLNPDFAPKNRALFDLGHAAHRLLLGAGGAIRVIDFDDYKTKAAQAERASAYLAGETPVLTHQMANVEAMVRAARLQIARTELRDVAFVNGKPEQTLVWREGDVWCRCLLDWLPNGGNRYPDYKSTTSSANPELWGSRTMFDIGGHVQAAFYRRGIRAVFGIEAELIFLVQEHDEPHALSLVAPSPWALDLGDRLINEGLGWWRWCRKHDRWPGYTGRVVYADPPPWIENRQVNREIRTQTAAEIGEDLKRLAIEFQAPSERDAA